MREEILIDGRTYTADDSDTDAIIAAIKEASGCRITHEFFGLLEDFIDEDFIGSFVRENPAEAAGIIQSIRVIPPEKPKPSLTEAVRIILPKYFPDGFRPKLKRDYILFRNHAESERIPLPPGNDKLRQAIESEGTYLDGAVFIVSKELTDTAGRLISGIQDTRAEVVFYSPLMEALKTTLTENHIYSLEMFRDFLHAKFTTLFYNAESFTFSCLPQEEAVRSDILRVWGTEKALYPSEIAERLPYIPPGNITQCLKASPDFVKTDEGRYFLMSRLEISADERKEIFRFVYGECKARGFAPIVNIPCETVRQNNSELTGDGIYTAVFRKVLEGRFHRKHKIITMTDSGPDIREIFRAYCRDRSECTVGELEKLARDLTDAVYSRGIFSALYDCMVRVSKDRFTADYSVDFDADGVDRAISLTMAGRRFMPIKGVTTFTVFPECGRKWNHYILESFCYRFSRKYELRFYTASTNSSIPPFNTRNIGIIAEKGLAMTYTEMLAEILSAQNVELAEEKAGKFLVDAGLMGRANFGGLGEALRMASEIRNRRN